MNSEKDISRKQFIRTVGSVVAGGSILGISGALLYRTFIRPGQDGPIESGSLQMKSNNSQSPYRLVSSFGIPEWVESFELIGDKLVVAAANNIFIYDHSGRLLNNFAVGSHVRDIAVEGDMIYLLFPTRIEVYSADGEWVRDWEACSDQSDYCSFALAPGSVFVSDAANKNICKYTNEGNFVKFINSPNGFVIPSYSFGVTYTDGIIHCSNSGRHQIEKYSLDGEYLGAFGKAGGAAGLFCGCCNPVYLTHTPTGEIITSEKGNPRISCYGSDGQFRSVLLDHNALGGGTVAYNIKVLDDKIFVAGKKIISTFQYDKTLAASTACSGCAVNCPLRKGII
ncbi:MAG: hypothetical protein LBQ60_07580 [Bacteroidales bacterium]|jgi:hypothetical protein|nr:hypothetical protein [Bacteroidales bacterium]